MSAKSSAISREVKNSGTSYIPWSLRGFLSHPSDGSQPAKRSRGTTDRLESDTSARRRNRENRDVTPEPNSSTMVIQYPCSLRHMSAISNVPTATDYCLNFERILSTFLLLHMTSPCLSFIQLFAVYSYMEILLCPCHTLFRKVTQAQRRGEGVSVLFIV